MLSDVHLGSLHLKLLMLKGETNCEACCFSSFRSSERSEGLNVGRNLTLTLEHEYSLPGDQTAGRGFERVLAGGTAVPEIVVSTETFMKMHANLVLHGNLGQWSDWLP